MNSSKYALSRTENDISQERSGVVAVSQPQPQWFNTAAPAPVSQGSTFASYLEVPFMNKRLILTCSLLGILIGWAAILVWPRSYESAAMLKVKMGRENVSLDPTTSPNGAPVMSLRKTQEEEIASLVEILNSRQVAEKVVEELGADVILSGTLKTTELKPEDRNLGSTAVSEALLLVKSKVNGVLSGALRRAGIKDDLSNRELAIRQIESAVGIVSPVNSSVVTIVTRADTPDMAQAIAKEVTESFLDEHLKGTHTDGSYAFFEGQSADAEGRLTELVAERAKYMQDNKIVSVEENRKLLSAQISGIDRDMAIATGDLEQALAEVDDLKSKLLAVDDEVIAEKINGRDSTWSGMRQQIYELEMEEQRIAAGFTENHPRLKRLRTQLIGAREILEQMDSEGVEENTTPNPIKVGIREELQQRETLIVGLRSMITEKQMQQQDLLAQAKGLLSKERHLTHVDREIDLETANVRLMREKLEQARVNDELFTGKFSNIHVFQPATFVERATSPNKKFLGVGFMFLGLMTGLAMSFMRDGASPTLRTPDDIESGLGAPVVANIPQLKNMGSPGLKNKKIYRRKCRELMAEILMTQHRTGQRRGRSLGIIGVDVCAGASTLAVNLAISSDVDCHLKTVLVDADSRNRSVSEMFGLNGVPGLVELLSGTASHDECLQKVEDGKIELIASSADSCEEMLSNSAEEIEQALEAYLQDCDLLIVDLPAASQPDQAVALAQHLDYILVVVESEKTQSQATGRLLNRLDQCNTEVIGVVLTKTRNYLPRFIRSFVAPQV